MGWAFHNGCGPYYTRTRRVGSRFVREYLGNGPRARMAAQHDAEHRAQLAADRGALAAEREQGREVSDLLAQLDALTRRATADTLTAEGLHYHRGEWRRTR